MLVTEGKLKYCADMLRMTLKMIVYEQQGVPGRALACAQSSGFEICVIHMGTTLGEFHIALLG